MIAIKNKSRLKGVHPDIVKMLAEYEKIGTTPITISEGTRSTATQAAYVKKGVSWTMNSRHLTGDAVDIYPLTPQGTLITTWPMFHKLAAEMKKAAKAAGVQIEWGGDWIRTKDGPHWQVPNSKRRIRTESTAAKQVVAGSGFAGLLSGASGIQTALEMQRDGLTNGNIASIVVSGVIVAIAIGVAIMEWRNYRDRSNLEIHRS